MFRKLKLKFILTNLATTTVVLLIAFSAIYFSASASINHPPTPRDNDLLQNQEVMELFQNRLDLEHEQSMRSLLFILIITGICVEIAVFLISFYLADQSIQPVKETYEAQKMFIANASHEIKTPLAVIQANLEAADIHGNHWIDNIAIKTEELANLNQQLLMLARVESGIDPSKDLTEINLKPYVQKITAPLLPQIDQKTAHLKIKSPKTPVKISVHEPSLKQILCILLDNAIKYCDHSITIDLSNHQISITNDGTTISQEQLTHIFERFYQTDKTKSGVGLGLAIAHQLAEQNHWRLTASSDAQSTTFTLSI